MIVGNGDIASVLSDREGAIIFASGVSDSSCTDGLKFQREIDLLMRQDKSKCIFYFSSIGVYTSKSPYFQHKKLCEKLISGNFANYNIIRLGNIDFGTNPNTFLNKLRAMIAAGESVTIFDEYRYMISAEKLNLLINNLPLVGRNSICCFDRMALVKDLL